MHDLETVKDTIIKEFVTKLIDAVLKKHIATKEARRRTFGIAFLLAIAVGAVLVYFEHVSKLTYELLAEAFAEYAPAAMAMYELLPHLLGTSALVMLTSSILTELMAVYDLDKHKKITEKVVEASFLLCFVLTGLLLISAEMIAITTGDHEPLKAIAAFLFTSEMPSQAVWASLVLAAAVFVPYCIVQKTPDALAYCKASAAAIREQWEERSRPRKWIR